MFWNDGAVSYIDQRALPELVRSRAGSAAAIVDAIATGAVSGARCIDLFAAFGVALAQRQVGPADERARWLQRLRTAARGGARGCNALERVLGAIAANALGEAQAALEERAAVERAIARHTSGLLPPRVSVMTHGNSGAFSTGAIGTAVAAIVEAHRSGKEVHAYVSESRPSLGGLRLAAFELAAAGVACTVFVDGAAAALLASKRITAVLVGADAIAANGDLLAPIGTYAIALAAAQHGIPFYVAAPRAMVDEAARHGENFVITHDGSACPPVDCKPAFGVSAYPVRSDLTPGRLITAVITEYGQTQPPYDESLATLFTRPCFERVAKAKNQQHRPASLGDVASHDPSDDPV